MGTTNSHDGKNCNQESGDWSEARWAPERGRQLMDNTMWWRRVLYLLGPEKKGFALFVVESEK